MAVKYTKVVEEDLDLGSATVDVPMPGGGSMTGRQINPGTFFTFNVQKFGTSGDGLTDDTAAIRRAIAAAQAAGGGVVYFPNGTYRLTGELSVTANGVKFLGESKLGAILQWDDTANRGIVVDTAVADPVSSALTSDAAFGDRTIAVTSGATFTVGAWAFVDDGATNTTTLQTRIKSISSNNVTLEDAMPGPLTVGAAATLYSHVAHPLLTGISFRQLTLRCVTAAPTSLQTLLLLSRVDDHAVDDCVFNGSTGPLITHRQTYQGHVCNSTFRNAVTVAGTAIASQTATGLLVAHNDIYMCQFGITYASSPYCRTIGNRINGRQTNVALGRGIRYGQSSNFAVVSGNNISDTNLYGIYLQDSSFGAVTGNTVAFTGSASDTGEHGIQFGGQDAGNYCNHNTCSGNVIIGASGYGIALNNTTPAQTTRHTVAGNVISLCTWGAIICTGNENSITGNQCAAPGASVIGAIIRISGGGDYNTVVGNTLTNEDTSGTTGIRSDGGGGHNMFDMNVVTTPTYIPQNTYAATDVLGASTAYVTAALTRAPIRNTTEVATPANTNETTAWTIPIPAGLCTATTHGFRIKAIFTIAANNNTKTLRFKLGAAVLTGDAGGSFDAQQYQVTMDVEVCYVSATAAKFFVNWFSNHVSTGRNTPGGTFATDSTIDWTAGFNITITIQNGSASAADITFRMGTVDFDGVPQGV